MTPLRKRLTPLARRMAEDLLVPYAGRFGPGSFVWFPEGQARERGADGDVKVVFITNKSFRSDDVD